jgi:FtsP/CotA-like multicopper oxidase with cupredoxin domain
MKRGEVQRWRFINTQIFNYLNLSLDEHVLHEYMTDGWGREDYRNHPDARELNSNGLLLAPGNRSSVLVKAGAPGKYYLRSLPFHIAQGRERAVLPEDILARIIVLEDSQPMSLAPAPLPVGDFLSPITDAEFARAGGRKRSIVFNFIGNESPVQLQASNSIIQNVMLDAIEEWTIFNCNSISFPFHVHVNPMCVVRINGLAVDPYWCDTLPLPPGGTPEMPTSVTVRIRFKDFAGPFVLHNQMLHYSDLGMIQRVTVIPA